MPLNLVGAEFRKPLSQGLNLSIYQYLLMFDMEENVHRYFAQIQRRMYY